METDYRLPFYVVNEAEVPEMTGQLSLFTAPVFLLFEEKKDYARFVSMERLTRRLEEIQ